MTDADTGREMLMNLNIYRYEGRWFAGNMPGYVGLGDTPEDALRDMLLHYNTHERPNYPIRRGVASGSRDKLGLNEGEENREQTNG